MRWNWFVLCVALLPHYGATVDRNNFKTCQQSSFCQRCRGVPVGKSTYNVLLNTLKEDASSIQAEMVNKQNGIRFKLQLFSLQDRTFRLKINEWAPLKPRYEVEFALNGEPALEKLEVIERNAEYITVKSGPNKVKIYARPFRADFYSGDQLVISANARGLMRFEHIRQKSEGEQSEGERAEEGEEVPVEDDTASDPGAWEENFKSHHDSKPNGPTAVALDFSFIGAHHAYGIPEHADSFALKSTKSTDPYRLYNLDVFEYELYNNMALYGSVPVLVAHGPLSTVGVFWMNAAETWVDILGTADQNVVSSIVNFVSGSATRSQVDAHFMSESGIIDTFFMLGPQPKDVFWQYSKLTGTAPLPQLFAIAHHQSRWNYNDQDDVRNVDAKFDEHDIPNDAMWLDIEHTNNKKYFTWDRIKFAQPADMINNLTAKGRKMVVIVDPHIKRDGSYFLHNDAESRGYYVKTKDGKDFEGWCWPGSSSYLDFLNPEVRSYYSSRYLLENYYGTTLDLFIWNDMNEPSVFNGPEITMHKDCVHHGGWEHRDIHNIYGLLHTMATYDGLLKRSEGKIRPFILTRAHYAGTQRYTSVWTGDNTAEWGHLKITIPMCLSMSVAGISFCGADVGGFFKNPDAELFARWYQAGAFQPFFRTHSHIDTKRREPWLFDEQTMLIIREAIRTRYSYLPFWYTLFYEHEQTGLPIMRPLWVEYPSDTATYTIDDEYLLGTALLVHPVTEPGVSEVRVYLPGSKDIWYDVETYEAFTGGNVVSIPVTLFKVYIQSLKQNLLSCKFLDHFVDQREDASLVHFLTINSETPVFQRGGTIVPKKERIRRASPLMHDDPYTLIVALDKNRSASGILYIDDEHSFEYRNGKYLYLSLTFNGNKLSSRFLSKTHYPTRSWLERVVILGLPPGITEGHVINSSDGRVLETKYDPRKQSLVIRKPAVSMAEEWTIALQ